MKTEYLQHGFEDYKRAIIYEDQITEDGKIVYGISKKKALRPYFYVFADDFVPEDKCIVEVEGGYTGICGENLKRVYTRLPTDISYIRNSFSKTFEADVLYPWRSRIDNGYVIKENVRLFLDIEVAMGNRFDKTSTRYPITCVSVYDSMSKEYVVFVWRSDLDRAILSEKRLERIKRKDEDNHREMTYKVYTFPNEKDMLSALCKHIVDVNPDLLTAWNTAFDYPYIINRMYSLQMNPSLLSPISFVGIDKYDGEAIVKGRFILDLLQAYKKIHIGQLESFKLDDVGIFEFGVPKIKHDETFEEMWKRDINQLVEYNIADLEICVRLDEKVKVMDFFEGISNFTGAPLDECLANSRILDFYMLKEAHKMGLCLPSADKNAIAPNFEGAIVNEPIKGIHKNVVCLDLTALYPSIIMAGNMSLETIDNDGDIKFGNGVSFRSQPVGFIPSLIQDFLDRRKNIKKEMLDEFEKNGKTNKYEVLDAQQNVTKFLVNSLYGVLGFYKSRYFVEDIAKTITWVGREINLHTQEVAVNNGYTVIASDTDSIYVSMPVECSLDDIIKRGYDLQEKINSSYVKFADKYNIKDYDIFSIKFEKVYSVALFCKKKRYVGKLQWKEGKVYDEAKYGVLYDIVGFASRRSDSSRFTKTFLKELYKLMLDEVGKVKIYEFINKKVEEFKKADVDDIAIPKNFTKEFNLYEGGSANSVFINSAKMCNLRYNMDIGGGSKVLFIYAKTAPGGFCWMRGDSKILEKEGIRIDYDAMLERGIYMQLPTFFDALGMSVEDLKTGTTQLKLSDFFMEDDGQEDESISI